MHRHDADTEHLSRLAVDYALDRLRLDPPPLDRPRSEADLASRLGPSVTETGLGIDEAFRRFTEVLAPACISVDHPRFLAFVPGAPTEAATIFDLVVSASNIYAGSWLEGAGAVHAENEALAWLAGLAGLPAGAGGVFVSGGTAGNLSALVAARWTWRHRDLERRRALRPVVLAAPGAHSSVVQAASVMDADVVMVPGGEFGRLTRSGVDRIRDSLTPEVRERIAAVVATAGTTNLGLVDDLVAAADLAEELGVWFHVDGAYGAAALCVEEMRPFFDGIERADSFIVDPHKWLFAPFDACALVYREPDRARAAHTQSAGYLDVLAQDHQEPPNPSDLAHHLSRRARGLPLWFSLAVHGTRAYAEAVATTLATARAAAHLVAAAPHLELLCPVELSVVALRRRGWTPRDYAAWCEGLLDEGLAFVTPTTLRPGVELDVGSIPDTVLRWCIVNPRTTIDDIALLVERLGTEPRT